MEKPLLYRGIHFLRKAGIRNFAVKSFLWVHTWFDHLFAGIRDKKTGAALQKKLSQLPRENGHVVIPVLDFTMKVRADDPGLSKDLILQGVREQDAVQFLQPYLAGCETIIEIGANQGYYLIQEGLHSPPGARIHAFEPHPDNVKTAELNVQLNGIGQKCHLLQAAVSDRQGMANLNVSKRSNWHSLTRYNEDKLDFSGGTIQVDTLSIDEYSKAAGIDRVDLIRMDVEGHESAVIRGAVRTISRSAGLLIFMEFHTSLLRQAGESPEGFLQLLKDLGLHCLTVCGNGRHLVEPSWDELIQNLELITARYGTHMFFVKNGNLPTDGRCPLGTADLAR